VKGRKKISNAVINRLPKYHRYLKALQQMGISRVSSNDLGKRMGITPSQVRQDFFNFGGFGLQGYGYDVELLLKEISSILGLDVQYNMIIIGAGNLGQSLAKHTSFEKKGFKLVGIFDAKPHLIGQKIRDIEINHYDEIDKFFQNNHVDIAVITVPRVYAREVAAKVVSLGVKAIWNFASIELEVPDDVIVENIHLSESLMVLGYKLKEAYGQGEKCDSKKAAGR